MRLGLGLLAFALVYDLASCWYDPQRTNERRIAQNHIADGLCLAAERYGNVERCKRYEAIHAMHSLRFLWLGLMERMEKREALLSLIDPRFYVYHFETKCGYGSTCREKFDWMLFFGTFFLPVFAAYYFLCMSPRKIAYEYTDKIV
jgi:hypothetical protein